MVMALWNCFNWVRWRQVDLTVILWQPSNEYFEEITEMLARNSEILTVRTVNIREDSFRKFVTELYAIDYADPKKIARKIQRLEQPPHRIHVLKIRLSNPKFSAQDTLNRVRCETIGDIKDEIRRKYRGLIKDYVYDIIIHSTETDYQSVEFENLMLKYLKDSKVAYD